MHIQHKSTVLKYEIIIKYCRKTVYLIKYIKNTLRFYMNKAVTKFLTVCMIVSMRFLTSCSNDIESETVDSQNTDVSSEAVQSETEQVIQETTSPAEIDWTSADRFTGTADDTESEEYVDMSGKIGDYGFITDDITDSAIFWGYKGNKGAYFTTLSFRHNGDEKIIGKRSHGVTVEQRKEYITILDSIFVSDTTRDVCVKDYLDEKSTGYNNENGERCKIRTNCSWNITPTKYLYINYDKDEREPKQIWIDEIENVIYNDTGSTDTPAIIRESWEFTTGGYNIAVVNACNIYNNGHYTGAEYSEDLYPSSDDLPYGENHYICSYCYIL